MLFSLSTLLKNSLRKDSTALRLDATLSLLDRLAMYKLTICESEILALTLPSRSDIDSLAAMLSLAAFSLADKLISSLSLVAFSLK